MALGITRRLCIIHRPTQGPPRPGSTQPVDEMKLNIEQPMTANSQSANLKVVVSLVAIANLAYFAVEFAMAKHLGSVALFADSVDFLEDAAVNALVLAGLGLSLKHRALLGMVLAAMLMLPVFAAIWTLIEKFHDPSEPDSLGMSLTGLGALAVNVTCAILLLRFKNVSGSLTRAAFLSARNDALANIAIILAAAVTWIFPSHWPDVVVGIAIGIMNADAAKQVWLSARAEYG